MSVHANQTKGNLATFYYTEGSMADYLYVSLDFTVGWLRKEIQTRTRAKIEEQWPLQPNIWEPSTHSSLASIIITTNRHGSKAFTDDSQKLHELCDLGDVIYAVVPSPQSALCNPQFAALLPESLSCPIRRCMERQKDGLEGKLLEATEARREMEHEEERERAHEQERELKMLETLEARWESKRAEERKQEKEQRAEERKQENARWESKRAEERKQEEERRTEQRKQEQAQCAEEREQQKEQWAQERRHETEARRIEKEEADKNYEDLRQHLLDVEETVLNTAGWLAAGNDTKMLDHIKLHHLVDKAQEKLALKAGLTNDPLGASRAWREALGPSYVLSTRLERAYSLLRDPEIQLDPSTNNLVSSREGMTLAADAFSVICHRGDKVAHPVAAPRT